jgi:hypothetical protein
VLLISFLVDKVVTNSDPCVVVMMGLTSVAVGWPDGVVDDVTARVEPAKTPESKVD